MLSAVSGPSLGLLSARGWMEVDIIQAVKSNDIVGWSCLLVVGVFSVLSWSIIIRKSLQFHRMQKETREFAAHCQEKYGDLHAAFRHARNYSHSPLAQIVQEAYVEMEMEQWFKNTPHLSIEQRARWIRDDLERVLSRTIESEVRHMEENMAFLTTTANVCPFLGLLGTVWGILASFQAVAITRSATIQAIAPGVSTALVTTVGGLVAAIPAVIAYNVFASQTMAMSSRMESFATEVTGLFEKMAMHQEAK